MYAIYEVSRIEYRHIIDNIYDISHYICYTLSILHTIYIMCDMTGILIIHNTYQICYRSYPLYILYGLLVLYKVCIVGVIRITYRINCIRERYVYYNESIYYTYYVISYTCYIAYAYIISDIMPIRLHLVVSYIIRCV